VDVKVGPDNIYPERGRIWVSNGPTTCLAQSQSNGGLGSETAIPLASLLPAARHSHAPICIVTSTGSVGILDISSVNDDASAPWLIRFSF
jgi:hypothetical protein